MFLTSCPSLNPIQHPGSWGAQLWPPHDSAVMTHASLKCGSCKGSAQTPQLRTPNFYQQWLRGPLLNTPQDIGSSQCKSNGMFDRRVIFCNDLPLGYHQAKLHSDTEYNAGDIVVGHAPLGQEDQGSTPSPSIISSCSLLFFSKTSDASKIHCVMWHFVLQSHLLRVWLKYGKHFH